jgi:prevent-host-death family protein
METVSVKELKAHLSEYLRKAAAGERIAVTRRGTEIAQLGPLAETRRALQDLREKGRIRWSGGKPKGLQGVTPRGAAISKTISEDRR